MGEKSINTLRLAAHALLIIMLGKDIEIYIDCRFAAYVHATHNHDIISLGYAVSYGGE